MSPALMTRPLSRAHYKLSGHGSVVFTEVVGTWQAAFSVEKIPAALDPTDRWTMVDSGGLAVQMIGLAVCNSV